MGITGLLPFLEKASSACHLRDLRGKCVAIDSYCWLHRGAFGCAERLARGEPTDSHIQYCLKYVQLLLSYNIKPILVFDGRHLPAKAATEAKRRESRENARKRGAELLRIGRVDEARNYLRRCVDITHDMALQLIKQCRKLNVDCVVAPYEADAQLAFLNRADIAQYVITEDSDLVLFGCNRILFKLDLAGNGRLVESSKLHLAMGCKEDSFQFAKFRYMCILSGCDYLDSLPGIGLAKACRFVLKTEDPDIRRALAKIPSYLNMRKLTVSEEYKDDFLRADASFKHMIVYDPVQRRQARLLDPVVESTAEEYCCNAGEFLDEQTAFNLAIGNLDPFTLRQMDHWHPDSVENVNDTKRHPSIWEKNYNALIEKKQLKLMNSKNTTNLDIATITTFVKRPPLNIDFVQQGTQDTIKDVLQLYGIERNEPPLKRPCHITPTPATPSASTAIEYDDLDALGTMAMLEGPTTPKRNRNPFVLASGRSVEGGDTLLSPTKITPENRSLLRNVVPVKRIDYSQQRPEAVSTTATTGRLSRFKRAATTAESSHGGQKVISRFFCSQETKTQMNQTVAPTTTAKSPEANEKPASSTYESPTAIVKEIQSRRVKILEATALYLQSPEAQQPNRGERTPEKLRLNQHLVSPDEHTHSTDFGSGILMEQKTRTDEDILGDTESSDGLSSSQKENEDTVSSTSKHDCLSPRPPTSARLALFECRIGRKNDGALKCTEENSDVLAIVLDDNEDAAEDTGQSSGIFVATLEEEPKEDTLQPKAQSNVPSNSIFNATNSIKSNTVGARHTQSRSTCKRPGLSTNRRKHSQKSDNDGGLTQSKLSMFGFQKKISMQLGNQ